MGRAERRLLERQKAQSQKVYTLTEDELKRIKRNAVDNALKNVAKSDVISNIKDEITADAVNTAMLLMLVLPMKVLMEDYWPKTYAKRIPEFTDKLLKKYNMWIDGKLDMEQMKKDLWEYGGVRLEETQ